jgi:L-ascorbate metabolism protein UlaG (beta-lactamase superfamily)
MPSLRTEPLRGDLVSALARPETSPVLYWLGQAGFALRLDTMLVLIDPYLSDALAVKYAGSALPHARMMAAPIDARHLPPVDLVLITHRHGDHLDLPTLAAIAEQSPRCRFILPAAEAHQLVGQGIEADCIVGVDAGEHWTFGPLTVHPVPAAHEALDRNDAGQHHHLGYVISTGGITLYHSGDCVPFAGLDEALAPYTIDLALLPVNGRDSYRASMGVPGNFTLEEALSLCRRLRIPTLLAHHFGMFAFNTIAPELIETAARCDGHLHIHPAVLGTRYVLGAAVAAAAPADLASAI